MVLRLWTSSSSTSICRGRNTWPCLTSSVTSLRNSFQLFTTSTSTGTLSSLICTDRTTQQLSHHTSKVDQSLQFCTVFTDRPIHQLYRASHWDHPVLKKGLLLYSMPTSLIALWRRTYTYRDHPVSLREHLWWDSGNQHLVPLWI